MQSSGIYTLANDAVFDQLVALLNSIEVNVSRDIPVCVIPYNDQLERVKEEIATRANVTIFADKSSMQYWEDFYSQVWNAHPKAHQKVQGHPKWYKNSSLFRKMCAFDGQFDKFVFYDADSLAMNPLNRVLEKLNDYEFIFDDWEHKKATPVAALNFSVIENAISLPEAQVRSKIHCSSFFGSKLGVFNQHEREILKEQLINNHEYDWINELSLWCDADLFNYMTLRCDRPLFNFTLSPDGQDRTGNCADADPFVNVNNILYNKEGLKPIHRLHYMNYPSICFQRLSQGEDVNIRYQDEFLHYRFLKNPEQKPRYLNPPSPLTTTSRNFQKAIHKVKKILTLAPVN